jgi:hypothetical protein
MGLDSLEGPEMCGIFEIEDVNDRLVLGWLFDVSFPNPRDFNTIYAF